MLPILVIGSGPAGASTAIFLQRMGAEVVVVTGKKNAKGLKVGESLPPDALLLIEQLKLAEEFRNAGHARCFGNQSLWGSDQIHYTDFIEHPVGHGWHIDRLGFEAMLMREVRRLGVAVHDGAIITAAEFDGHCWQVTRANSSPECFSFVVDATGRNTWFARRRGAQRLYEDRQLALVAFLESRKADGAESPSQIEAIENGWWYSARLPADRVATAFVCNPGAEQRKALLEPENWWALIERTKVTAEKIGRADHAMIGLPGFVSADSGMLDRVHGERWVAVGDAALAYDPIASHGILMAMVSARDAALAIRELLKGDTTALEAYQETLTWAFRNYAVRRREFYLAEQRFPGSAYWEERIAAKVWEGSDHPRHRVWEGSDHPRHR